VAVVTISSKVDVQCYKILYKNIWDLNFLPQFCWSFTCNSNFRKFNPKL